MSARARSSRSFNAEATFRVLVAELDATPAWDEWHGMQATHKVICKAGHTCWPWPTSVQQGRGVCRKCAGKVWDVFYVTVNDSAGLVKFGITSGDPKDRLGYHRSDGYKRTVFVVCGIDAQSLETDVLGVLDAHGYEAVHGREYFEVSALNLILEMARPYSNDVAA